MLKEYRILDLPVVDKEQRPVGMIDAAGFGAVAGGG